ncbi:MAG: DgsA anti-repressor MtfA [Bacteroidetes bacterium]|nr:MAG: DgsA anti-repressor MtfA [Bacteroidota bacterium]
MEDIVSSILILLIFTPFICLILFLIYRLILTLDSLLFLVTGRDVFNHFELIPKQLPPSQEKILLQYFTYYNKLSDKKKLIFCSRVVKFMASKEFETRKELELTEEMKVMIAASAVQLTFGLRNYTFPHFKRIIIYPEEFYSKATKEYHRGEVNSRGVIVLSWKYFVKGYAVEDDRINLGLHEMAHALFIQNLFVRSDIDMTFDNYFDEFRAKGTKAFWDIRKGKNTYIREYAGTNLGEFFSVCIEYFFEVPKELKGKHPKLYRYLTKLLNQDPAKVLIH